jgi:hypothetical protein
MAIEVNQGIIVGITTDIETLPSVLFWGPKEVNNLKFDSFYWNYGKIINCDERIYNPEQIIDIISRELGLLSKKRNLDQFYDELIDVSIFPKEGISIIFHAFQLGTVMENHSSDFFLILNMLQSISIIHRIDSKVVFQIVLCCR